MPMSNLTGEIMTNNAEQLSVEKALEADKALEALERTLVIMEQHKETGYADDFISAFRFLDEHGKNLCTALTRLSELEPIIQELVEARKLATPGEWCYRSHKFDDWGWVTVDKPERFHVANARAGGDYDANEHRKNGTDPYEHNARFIALAANRIAKIGGG